MRIIAGKWKGLSLKSPDTPLTRPTSDRLRETIFNILSAYFMKEEMTFDNFKVLDCFAGTGALGLEALSRGAEYATFIEQNPEACRNLRANIARLKAAKQCQIIPSDITYLHPSTIAYNLVFLDPPYDQALCEKTLEKLVQHHWLADQSIIVVETRASELLVVPKEFQLLKDRRMGNSKVSILRRYLPNH